MSEERGQAIRRRRLALGVNSQDQFAEATGVSRRAIARAEAGDPAVRDSTFVRLELWLDQAELGRKDGAPPEHQCARAPVVFRIAGNFGVSVTVEGPPEEADMLREQVELIIEKMQRAPVDEAP